MEPIHYEKILNSGLFPAQEIYTQLSKYLPEEGFSFEQFSNTMVLNVLRSNLSAYPQKDVASICQLLFHMYSFHVGKGRVYEIGDSIAEMLLNTKLDIDVSLLKSPMSEIILLIPDNLIQIHNEETGIHDVYTIYVNFKEFSENNKIVKVLCVGRPNTNSIHEFDDGFFYFRFDLGPGKVLNAIKEITGKWQENPARYSYSSIYDDLETMPRIGQLVFNTLLYITSKDCDIRIKQTRYVEMKKRIDGIKSKGKARKLLNRIDKESKYSRYVIGDSVQLSDDERDLYRIARQKLKVRFKVGGHWRAQWYGTRDNQYQKPKWIRPYFKGPELAELIKSIGVLR